MSLSLSGADVARFQRAVETLLAPLDYPDVESWSAAALEEVDALFRADRSMIVFPSGGTVGAYSENLPPEGRIQLQAAISEMGPGKLRSDQADVESVLHHRRQAGLDVWHNQMLMQASGRSIDSIPFYNEVLVPLGVAHGSGMVSPLPVGEAWLSIAHSRPSDDPFGIEGGMELLRMLRPAFVAGARALATYDQTRQTLAGALESLGHPVMVVDSSGREQFRSTSLLRLLHDEPESSRVIAEMQALASSVADVRRRPAKTSTDSPRQPGRRSLTTSVSSYEIRAVLIAEDVLGGQGGVLVELDPAAPQLPSNKRLMDRYGLTAREADVALLLARGLSNREAARRLSISPYTVRTHVEHVFRKLGIHSRKALALVLMDGTSFD